MRPPRGLAAAAIAAGLALTAAGPSGHLSAAADDPVDELRQDAEHAASMLDQSPAGNPWASRIDALEASDPSAPATEEGLAGVREEVDAVLNAIVAPEPFTFTMTGTSNTLRLPIRNTSTQPLRVDVRVRSPKLQPDEPLQEVVVPELASVEVEVPVTARSRGTFTIEVDVQAPDGYRLGAPVVLKGRVTHVTGLSQVVTAGAALVLGSWWYMHLRRRRAQRRLATTVPN
jgi:hypothetical protein